MRNISTPDLINILNNTPVVDIPYICYASGTYLICKNGKVVDIGVDLLDL